MRKSELKRMIAEAMMTESLGRGIRGQISGLEDYVDTLVTAKYVTPKEGEYLRKAVADLEKKWVAALKGKGLIGI